MSLHKRMSAYMSTWLLLETASFQTLEVGDQQATLSAQLQACNHSTKHCLGQVLDV